GQPKRLRQADVVTKFLKRGDRSLHLREGIRVIGLWRPEHPCESVPSCRTELDTPIAARPPALDGLLEHGVGILEPSGLRKRDRQRLQQLELPWLLGGQQGDRTG